MTIKFFGLFFLEECGLSPVAVSLLATTSPFCVSSGSFLAQAASKWCAHAGNVALDGHCLAAAASNDCTKKQQSLASRCFCTSLHPVAL